MNFAYWPIVPIQLVDLAIVDYALFPPCGPAVIMSHCQIIKPLTLEMKFS
jgi:hypothetical protein